MNPFFLALLNNNFRIERKNRLPDGQGGFNEVWGAVTDTRGRLRPASSAEREVAAQERREISHVLYVRASANILRGDRITGANRILDVLAIKEPSHMGHHLEIECLEIQLEGQP